jgi:putative lipoic acid-binding regulatory protein
LETSVIGIAQNPFVSNVYSLIQKVSTSKKESHLEGNKSSSAIPFLDVSINSLHHRSETYQNLVPMTLKLKWIADALGCGPLAQLKALGHFQIFIHEIKSAQVFHHICIAKTELGNFSCAVIPHIGIK